MKQPRGLWIQPSAGNPGFSGCLQVLTQLSGDARLIEPGRRGQEAGRFQHEVSLDWWKFGDNYPNYGEIWIEETKLNVSQCLLFMIELFK